MNYITQSMKHEKSPFSIVFLCEISIECKQT